MAPFNHSSMKKVHIIGVAGRIVYVPFSYETRHPHIITRNHCMVIFPWPVWASYLGYYWCTSHRKDLEIQVCLLSAYGGKNEAQVMENRPPHRRATFTVPVRGCGALWRYRSQSWPKQDWQILECLVFMSRRHNCLYWRGNRLLNYRNHVKTEKRLQHSRLPPLYME